jgi:ribosomal protein S18 acetylase RimI-like enzyme
VTGSEATAPTIRDADATDLPAVLAVWQQADAEPTTTDELDALIDLHRHDPKALWVAVAGDEVVGTLIAAFDGWRAHMHRLAVLPALRRRGIATALVRAAEARLAGLGVRRIACVLVDGAEDAERFWAAVGYRRQSERLRFVKNLTPDSSHAGSTVVR